MKKKIMAVTLCLAMVSTFAVGCGQKNETDSGKSEEKSSGKVEIEFVQVKREAAESYTKVIEAFEKENPDIVIKQNVVPDAQEVLMTRASSDSLPDMMNHWPTDAQFVQFEDEGLLLDLSEKDYMKNIDSKYLDAVKAKDGKNYIAPYNVNFMGVYYNKDKFEEAGYTMPTKWDELIALAEEIKPIATQAVDTGFCVNAKVADEPEKMEAIDKFLSFALSAEGAQIYTDNDKSPSCVTGVKAEVPQFQPFFDYVEANGFEADGAYPPTGFEDTKRGKIQNVLLDKDVDAFLKEMTNDWNQAVEDSK